MIKINIFKDKVDGLQKFEDSRGIIADVFYKKPLEHVALIKSEPNTIRGNHFHKETTQHMLITQGSLEYWFKKVDENGPAKMVLCKRGDLVTTPPQEIHALKIRDDGNEFIVFSSGLRGGQDYEFDTYRVDTIID